MHKNDDNEVSDDEVKEFEKELEESNVSINGEPLRVALSEVFADKLKKLYPLAPPEEKLKPASKN